MRHAQAFSRGQVQCVLVYTGLLQGSPFLVRQLGAKGLPVVHPQPSQAIHLQPQGCCWGSAEVQAHGGTEEQCSC